MKKLTLILVCSSLMFLFACSWLDTKAYYATHPTLAEDVKSQWGEPVLVEMLENGTVKWIYFIDDGWLTGEHSFLIRDGRVVDYGFD